MACRLTEHCCFYQIHKSCNKQGWDFLITGYCEGQYDWLCNRRRYFDLTGTMAPADFDPLDILPPAELPAVA